MLAGLCYVSEIEVVTLCSLLSARFGFGSVAERVLCVLDAGFADAFLLLFFAIAPATSYGLHAL